MATRALASLSHEGDKLAKRPRGHVITGLLQFESFSVESLPNERDQRFYGYQRTHFSLERTGEMRTRAASKATFSWTMMFSRQGTSQKLFRSTDWALKVHLA